MCYFCNCYAFVGFYVASSRPQTISFTQEMFADFMYKEITQGCGSTDIKAGVIGEIGCSWPFQGLINTKPSVPVNYIFT